MIEEYSLKKEAEKKRSTATARLNTLNDIITKSAVRGIYHHGFTTHYIKLMEKLIKEGSDAELTGNFDAAATHYDSAARIGKTTLELYMPPLRDLLEKLRKI